jgi:hypothetical protein
MIINLILRRKITNSFRFGGCLRAFSHRLRKKISVICGKTPKFARFYKIFILKYPNIGIVENEKT